MVTVMALIGVVVVLAMAPYGLIHYRIRNEQCDIERAIVLDEIRASITVYQMRDGHEWNRHPAYPLLTLQRRFRALSNAAVDVERSMAKAAEAFRKFGQAIPRDFR